MINRLIIILSVLLFGCNSKQTKDNICALDKDFSKNFPIWKVYGHFDEKDNTRNEVSRKMGFKFKSVGGCVVDDSLTRAVTFNNRITDSILSTKMGRNWQKIFEARVDSLYTVDTTCINIVKESSLTKNLINDTMKGQHFYSFRTPYKDITVIYYTISDFDKGLFLDKFRATVNLKQKKIIALDTIIYMH